MVMRTVVLPKVLKPFKCLDLVRLGKVYDGGYLVNKHDVLKSTQLVTFGIGQDFSFEEQFYSINQCPIIAYDDSSLVETNVNYQTFFTGNNVHVKSKVDITNVETIISQLPENTFLKCDIEGGEYELLDVVIRNSKLFSGMVFEFHDIHKYESINELMCFISKVNQKLVHIHINNYMYYKVGDEPNQQIIPDVVELVFSSSDNVTWSNEIVLPHIFDMPNNPLDSDFRILF